MTDDSEEFPTTQRRPSSVPPLPSVAEEQSAPTIAALINAIPVLEPTTPSATDTPSTRSRRRSSVSILQTLVASSMLLPTHDARKR